MTTPSGNKSPNLWVLLAGLTAVALVVQSLSNDDKMSGSESLVLPTTHSTENSAALADELELVSPDQAAIKRAAVHAGLVIGALGTDGAAQYSQLCYDALEREFVLSRQDRCFAFDLFAARLLEETEGFVPFHFAELNRLSRWRKVATPDYSGVGILTRRMALETEAEDIPVEAVPPPASILSTREIFPDDEDAVGSTDLGAEDMIYEDQIDQETYTSNQMQID